MIDRIIICDDAHSDSTVLPVKFNDRVIIDGKNRLGGDPIIGTVIGIAIYPHTVQYQVSWWNQGTIQEHWFAGFRLERTRP